MSSDQMKFTDLLARELILDDLRARDRDDALVQMAQFLVNRGNCEPPFVQAILDREAAHPSGLPMSDVKIAIPHTDTTYVQQSAILFARLREPVEFRSMGDPEERLSVSLISMFALKEKKRIGDLLETLLTVYQDPAVLRTLQSAAGKEAIYNQLRQKVDEVEV